jgi:hypothetical protein
MLCRADIEFCLQNGSTPRFYRDQMPLQAILAGLRDRRKYTVARDLPDPICSLQPWLSQIVIDTMNLTLLLNSTALTTKLRTGEFQEALISVFYRLLVFHSFEQPHTDCVVEMACQLGMITFMTTLHIQFGHRGPMPYVILMQQLKRAITNLIDNTPVNSAFQLWLIFIAGIAVLSPADQPWITSNISKIAQTLRISDWSGLQVVLKQFPWITLLHDIPAKRLWEAAMRTINELPGAALNQSSKARLIQSGSIASRR